MNKKKGCWSAEGVGPEFKLQYRKKKKKKQTTTEEENQDCAVIWGVFLVLHGVALPERVLPLIPVLHVTSFPCYLQASCVKQTLGQIESCFHFLKTFL
jgi:hypothetical protein